VAPPTVTMTQPARPPPAAGAIAADPLRGSKYRVLAELGKGGWSTVYEAVHLDLGRHFAVKVLHVAFANDPMSLERMRVEAQALGHLQSRHIVEVSDFGHTDDGRPFFVMPRLVGRTLAEELHQRGCLPPEEAIDLVQQLLAGLDVAHRAGLVHRDIKLDNLFLCDEGGGHRVVKILDFGIAKVLPGALGAEPPGLRTQDGEVMGTPRFIPPEQAMGREVGPRADLYGAGVVLYELLTGRDPFQHVKGFAPLLKAHVLEDAPSPSTVAPQPIEPALDDVIMRALAKRPQDRYASAAELSAALARALEWTRSVSVEAGRAPPRRSEPPILSAPVPPLRGATLRVACVVVLASAALSALAAAVLLRGP
jgi:eukaryotic-like serine/threonine-protein kinase